MWISWIRRCGFRYSNLEGTKERVMFSRKSLLPLMCIWFTMAYLSCSSESGQESSAYSDKVELEVHLGPASGLEDVATDDIFFTIRNRGDRTITELMAEITFLYPDGREAMRREWYLIDVDKMMEKAVAREEKKARWRPLPPGGVLRDGETVIGFFIGKPEMRKKARREWDKLSAEIRLVKVETKI
jgi:hypothetical protein